MSHVIAICNPTFLKSMARISSNIPCLSNYRRMIVKIVIVRVTWWHGLARVSCAQPHTHSDHANDVQRNLELMESRCFVVAPRPRAALSFNYIKDGTGSIYVKSITLPTVLRIRTNTIVDYRALLTRLLPCCAKSQSRMTVKLLRYILARTYSLFLFQDLK